eukprot:COSAG02_NODE_9427_length_2219_cov_7.830889_4_plen_92_part_00
MVSGVMAKKQPMMNITVDMHPTFDVAFPSSICCSIALRGSEVTAMIWFIGTASPSWGQLFFESTSKSFVTRQYGASLADGAGIWTAYFTVM